MAGTLKNLKARGRAKPARKVKVRSKKQTMRENLRQKPVSKSTGTRKYG